MGDRRESSDAPTSRLRARRHLQIVVGKPLWDLDLAVDMAMFSLGSSAGTPGEDGRGMAKPEYALHVQCPWRLVRAGIIELGSWDLARADPHALHGGPLGERIERLVRPRPEVLMLQLKTAGSLVLGLSGGMRLEVFPDSGATKGTSVEFWRFLAPGSERPHVVCESDGYFLDQGVEPTAMP